MTTAASLSSLGSDLAFSVSYGIANELLDAAHQANLSEEELIGIVLALSVILAALPSSFHMVKRELALRRTTVRLYTSDNDADNDAGKAQDKISGLIEFASLLVRMAQRISISICVQLLASNVRYKQPLRSVRIVSLLSVSIFFLFLESTSSVGKVV